MKKAAATSCFVYALRASFGRYSARLWALKKQDECYPDVQSHSRGWWGLFRHRLYEPHYRRRRRNASFL